MAQHKEREAEDRRTCTEVSPIRARGLTQGRVPPAPYLDTATGPLSNNVSLYATTVPLTEGKQVAFVGLPNIERMHIFAAAIS